MPDAIPFYNCYLLLLLLLLLLPNMSENRRGGWGPDAVIVEGVDGGDGGPPGALPTPAALDLQVE